MVDLSSYNTKMSLVVGSESKTITLYRDDYAFEQGPLSISSVPVAKMELDMNGNPIVGLLRQPIQVTVGLIPGSNSDKSLLDIVYSFRGLGDTNFISMMTIEYPSGTKISFKDGCLSNGMVGVNVTADGKISGGTYSFEFPGYEISYGQDKDFKNAFTINRQVRSK